MNKTILLIEDNKDISNNVKEYLELEWYKVDQVFDGEHWLDTALYKNYDLILLDVMLPEIDGISIAKKLTQKIDTPIIMVTAKDAIEDKLKWFESGAIDYIVKPFDLRELEVRISLVLNKKTESKCIQFEDVSLDMKKRYFTKAWDEVVLTQKEFLIIDYLYTLKESVVTRTDLIEYVWWGEDILSADGKLDVNISTIRSKLGKKIIKTIKWVWYTWGIS